MAYPPSKYQTDIIRPDEAVDVITNYCENKAIKSPSAAISLLHELEPFVDAWIARREIERMGGEL